MQDCGLIVDKLTAESQVYGGSSAAINFALFEDRILDRVTGQMVNPNMELYLLAGMSDMPKIDIMLEQHAGARRDRHRRAADRIDGVGHRQRRAQRHRRDASAACRCTRTGFWRPSSRRKQEGPIEGVCLQRRTATRGMGPACREHGSARRSGMKAFAYVNPTTEKEAVAALKVDGIAMPIAGGQDLLARMKDYIDSARPRRQRQEALDATIAATPDGGTEDRRGGEDRRPRPSMPRSRSCTRRSVAAAIEVGTPQIRNQGTVGGNVNQRPRCWYYRNEEFVCFKKGGSRCFAVNGENQYPRHFRQRRSQPHRAPVEPRGAVGRVRREVPRARPERRARGRGGRLLHAADAAERAQGKRARATRTCSPTSSCPRRAT